MSWLSKFVFDPVKAALARAAGSSNAGVAAAAKTTLDNLNTTAAAVGADLQGGLTANSAVAMKNDLVKGLEDTFKAGVDAYTMAALPPGVNVLAVEVENLGLDFAEQHALAYVSSLFAHVKAARAAERTVTASAPAAVDTSPK